MASEQRPEIMLSNFEVMKFLQQKKQRNMPKGQLATVIYETMGYFQTTDCVLQTEENIENYMKELKKLPLSKLEKLMLINTPPRSLIDVQTLIQFSEDTLTEEGSEQLVKLASYYFPEPEQEGEETEEQQ